MIERIEAIDDFFKLFIEDGLGRFVFCHCPFWTFCYWLLWNIGAYLGPFILFGLVFCVLPSLFFAGFLFAIYEDKRNFKFFKIILPIYVGLILLIVGIPYVYYGGFPSVLAEKNMQNFQWGFIKYWWAFFNCIQPFKNDDVPWKLYEYDYRSLQIILWAAALLITPGWFYFFFQHDKRQREELQKQIEKEDQEEEKRKRALENERIREENWRRRQAEEARIKKAAEDAKQKKIEETRGEDPWGSGFL